MFLRLYHSVYSVNGVNAIFRILGVRQHQCRTHTVRSAVDRMQMNNLNTHLSTDP